VKMAQQQTEQVDFGQVVNELTNRIRILEAKQSLFSEKLLVMNQNMIEEYKRIVEDNKKLNLTIDVLNEDIGNMKNVMRHLTQEASNFAKKEDVKVLEKYINLWNPLNFVTENDVLRMIGKKEVKKHGSDSSE